MSVTGAGMNFEPTYGAMLVGILISMALYGLVLMQTIMYLSTFFQDDHWSMVATVCFLWLLETAHVYFVGDYLYYHLVTSNCLPKMSITTKLENVTTVVIALITFIVHCFYTRRVWILSGKNWWLTGIASILTTTLFGLELSVTGITYKFPLYNQLHIMGPYITTGLALAASLDILIAGTIVCLLNRQRTGFKRTESLLNKIVVSVIGSGALTSITDVVILICFYTMPHNLVYLSMYSLLSDLYTISLLTSLNTRESLRSTHNHIHQVSLQNHPHIDTHLPAAAAFSTGSTSRKYFPPVVHVYQTTTVDSDI